jgi:type II secretory ATPase GspE/PulE/Tfp pilus assembly ATPase PilB-like protein
MARAILALYDLFVLFVVLLTIWVVHVALVSQGEITHELQLLPESLAQVLVVAANWRTGVALLLVLLIVGHFVLSRLAEPRVVATPIISSQINLTGIDPRAHDRVERVGALLKQRAADSKVDTIDLVDDIIVSAEFLGASDLHIEPKELVTHVWFRIDGIMRDVADLPKGRDMRVVNRLRVLSQLDMSTIDTPQDGRIAGKIRGKAMNLRLSVFPTHFGPKVVVRLLDAGANALPGLTELGIQPGVAAQFRRIIRAPRGMVLFTGPTGSGKTTLMYAALREIVSGDSMRRNIVTLEDPIERVIPDINQTQIDPRRGLSFAIGLRTILRQDPNVIMVGEIRDAETAEIALRAGQTGHLLMSTLHTSSAASAFGRLIEMGIQPFLLASSVTGVAGIRLVRRLCPHCRVKKTPSALTLSQLPVRLPPEFPCYESAGCEQCQQTGFSGRLLVLEFLEVNDAIARAVVERQSAGEIHRLAQQHGMVALLEDGLSKVSSGETSLIELLRVVA